LARDPGPEEAATAKECLENLLAALPEKQRKTLELHMTPSPDGKQETADKHYRRIADALDVSVSTVRRWLSEIREHLENDKRSVC
jgi:RNA polymerase sigma factor (sigma-70 family)